MTKVHVQPSAYALHAIQFRAGVLRLVVQKTACAVG
jgi:hypothetical protein